MQGKGIALALGCLLTVCVSSTAAPRLYSGAPQSSERIPLFFREAWKETPELPVTQAFVTNSDLEFETLRAGQERTSGCWFQFKSKQWVFGCWLDRGLRKCSHAVM